MPTPADDLFRDVLARSAVPVFKAAGFRKTGNAFHRRHGETVQVVDFQASGGSTGEERIFYVNVGVALDAICELAGVPVLEKPKEHECDERGIRMRLEGLLRGLPASWSLRVGEDPAKIATKLERAMRNLVAELDPIDGPAAYRAHRWFDGFRPNAVSAQVLYLLGDLDGARREVQALAQEFADRKNANRAEWWIERLHLDGLKANFEKRAR